MLRTKSLHIRSFRSDDMLDLSGIWEVEKTAYVPLSMGSLEHLLDRSYRVWLAHHQEEVAGYIAVRFNGDTCMVLRLVVHQHFRRLSVGKRMVNHVWRWFRDYSRRRTLAIPAPESNLPLQLFCRATGFTATEIIPDALTRGLCECCGGGLLQGCTYCDGDGRVKEAVYLMKRTGKRRRKSCT